MFVSIRAMNPGSVIELTVGNGLVLESRGGDLVELVGAVNASGEGRCGESEDEGGGTHDD